MTQSRKIIGAVAQVAQHFFDTQRNLTKAIECIHEAAKDGADIIVFAECYLGQFPYWIQYYDQSAENFNRVTSALYDGAIQVGGPECQAISKACSEAGIHVAMGCNELSDEPGSSTLYNSLLFFNREGQMIGRHRKLMPTYAERLIHGRGDGRDLRVHNTDIGMLGGLICWERHMTLSKYAMASMGEELHVAVWPGMWRSGKVAKGERIMEPDLKAPFECDQEFAIREYATETGNFVLSASAYFPAENISDEWREIIPNLQADWAVGASAIVAPGGTYLVPPLINQEKILMAEIDFNDRRLFKAWFDPMGHYSRPDVYSLQLNNVEGRERSYSQAASTSSLYKSLPQEGG